MFIVLCIIAGRMKGTEGRRKKIKKGGKEEGKREKRERKKMKTT